MGVAQCRIRWNLSVSRLRGRNRLIDGLGGGLVLQAIDLAHVHKTGTEQRPEQHGSSFGRAASEVPVLILRLNSSCSHSVLWRSSCRCAAPLARQQAGEGEQAFAGFLQAVGHGTVLEPPLADEEALRRAYISSEVTRRSCRCSWRQSPHAEPLPGICLSKFLCLWTVQRSTGTPSHTAAESPSSAPARRQ